MSDGILAHDALALLAYDVSVPAVAMRWRVVSPGVTSRQLPLGPLVLASLASRFVNNKEKEKVLVFCFHVFVAPED